LKAVVQRVTRGSVEVDGAVVGAIGGGLVILVGVAREDNEEDARLLADKVVNLRILPDSEGKFNLSALETQAGILAISQFTLFADTSKGRRPSFTGAAPAPDARPLFDNFVSLLKSTGLYVATGRFQEHMLVKIENDGPVTVVLDTRTWMPR